MNSKFITITGELGSGKSTVAKKLAALRGIRRYSTGDAQRQIAQSRGMTTLELNLLAETDSSIDQQIDSVFQGLSDALDSLVIDSRLAWHFIPQSMKIKLTVAPEEASVRVYKDASRVSEKSESVDEAYAKLIARRESEQRRYQHYYGVDIEDDKNFDYVVDTSSSCPDDAVTLINWMANLAEAGAQNAPQFWVSPKNLFPSKNLEDLSAEKVQAVRELIQENGFDNLHQVVVGRVGHDRIIIDGHKRTIAALSVNIPFVPVRFVDGNVVSNPACFHAWEAEQGFQFSHYPHST